MTAKPTPLEAFLKRDRLVVLIGVTGVTALAWLYLAVTAADMDTSMGASMKSAMPERWGALDFLMMFIMWAIMMVGMMLPSAAPMIFTYALVGRKKAEAGHAYAGTTIFAAGYLIAWTGFSLAATALQWALHETALLSPKMASNSAILGGGLFLAAAIYQWTPLKHACLKHCRTPFHFVMAKWRPGSGGAVRMGIEHGFYCVGCCWFLMALLFVLGVMNLVWIAALAVFVLIEKAVPAGEWVARISGLAMAAAGIYLVATA